MDEDVHDGGVFSVTGMLKTASEVAGIMYLSLYITETVTDIYLKQVANEKIYYLVKKLHANCICGKIHCVANNVI